MSLSRYAFAAVLLAALSPAGVRAQVADPAKPHYHVVKKVILGGQEGWDYLTYDAVRRRLFISRSTHVWVVDGFDESVVGDIPGTEGVHGIALADELHLGFTSNGRSSTVTVFDPTSLKALGSLNAGEGPDFILYVPDDKRLLTFNGRGRSISAFDARNGELVRTIPLDAKPESAVSDGNGKVFVNLEDKNALAVVDERKSKLKKVWALKGCERPTGLGFDPDYRILYVGCSNKLLFVVNADKGRVLARLPIGARVDAVAVDARNHFAFSANGDGTLTVIRAGSPTDFSVFEDVPTQEGARTLAFDPASRRIFLVTASFGPEEAQPEGRPRRPILPGTFTLLVLAP